jgi:hypothetical protein
VELTPDRKWMKLGQSKTVLGPQHYALTVIVGPRKKLKFSGPMCIESFTVQYGKCKHYEKFSLKRWKSTHYSYTSAGPVYWSKTYIS